MSKQKMTTQKKRRKLRVSPSRLRLYDTCPLQYKYKYIEKLPTLEYHFFKVGHELEDNFKTLVDGWTVTDQTLTWAWAIKLRENPEVKEIFRNWYTAYQGQRKMLQVKETNERQRIDRDDRDLQGVETRDVWLLWLTDFETDEFTIDVKTSASAYNEQQLQSLKRQIKMYYFFRRKPLKIIVVNKSNLDIQVFTVRVEELQDMRDKIEELNTAIDQDMLFATPSYQCKFCPYAEICER